MISAAASWLPLDAKDGRIVRDPSGRTLIATRPQRVSWRDHLAQPPDRASAFVGATRVPVSARVLHRPGIKREGGWAACVTGDTDRRRPGGVSTGAYTLAMTGVLVKHCTGDDRVFRTARLLRPEAASARGCQPLFSCDGATRVLEQPAPPLAAHAVFTITDGRDGRRAAVEGSNCSRAAILSTYPNWRIDLDPKPRGAAAISGIPSADSESRRSPLPEPGSAGPSFSFPVTGRDFRCGAASTPKSGLRCESSCRDEDRHVEEPVRAAKP